MTEKRFSYDSGSNQILCNSFIFCDFTHRNVVSVLNKQSEEITRLNEENEQLKKENDRLEWELCKTRDDLDYFANLKITAIGGEPE